MKVEKPARWFLGASVAAALGLMSASRGTMGQDPPPAAAKADKAAPPAAPAAKLAEAEKDDEARLRREVEALLPKPEALRPQPDPDIPDDPPPHEGALFEFPYRVGKPDIIQVEVLEALPGRPISGERLVRPDGTITLGFYGDIHVAGLTTMQIKEKVILQLRKFCTDEALGLTAETTLGEPGRDGAAPALPAGGGLPPVPDGELFVPKKPPDRAPKPEARNGSDVERATGAKVRLARGGPSRPLPPRDDPQEPATAQAQGAAPVRPDRGPGAIDIFIDGKLVDMKIQEKAAPPPPDPPVRMIAVPARESDRVLVDLASYNSHVYFVLGDVNSPGRLPCTGNETVLDALQFAGGLCPRAEAKDVRLVRPAKGKKPAKVYPINLAAIEKLGDARANLQLFPGDRLFVGRSAATVSAIKLNADAARTNTLLNTSLVFASVLKNFDRLGEPVDEKGRGEVNLKWNDTTLRINFGNEAPRVDPARRKAALKAWREYLSKTARSAGPDEEKLIDELVKALDR